MEKKSLCQDAKIILVVGMKMASVLILTVALIALNADASYQRIVSRPCVLNVILAIAVMNLTLAVTMTTA